MNLTSAILRDRKQLTYDVFEFEFETKEPFNFKAGQFVTIEVPAQAVAVAPAVTGPATDTPSPKPVFRSYSISSRPSANSTDSATANDTQKNRFSLLVKILENGIGSSYLKSLEPNTTDPNKSTINFLGPLGHFTFKSSQTTQDQNKNILFVATGTGLASIKSIIEDELVNKGNKQSLTLFFGLRHIRDIFYKEFFDNLAKKFPNFSYTLTLSQPETPNWEGSGGAVGRVTNLIETMTTQTNKLDQANTSTSSNNTINPLTTEAYICGLKDMVESVSTLLIQKGLSKESVHFERFN